MLTQPLYYGECRPRRRPADTALRPVIAWSLIVHLALAALLWLGQGEPAGKGEMTVELGALVTPPAVTAQPQAAMTMPVKAMPAQVTAAPQPAAQPSSAMRAQSQLAWPAAGPSTSPGFIPVPGNSPAHGGAPAPVPFPEQQRRFSAPFTPYSSSHGAA